MYSCTRVFVYLYLCTHVCNHVLLVYSCTRLYSRMCTHVLLYSFTCVLVYLCTRLLVYSCTCVLMYSCTCALVYSYTHVLIYSCTHVCTRVHVCCIHEKTHVCTRVCYTCTRACCIHAKHTKIRGRTTNWMYWWYQVRNFRKCLILIGFYRLF